MQTIDDLEAKILVLQEQVRRLASALNEAMRTPVLREYFSEVGDYGQPLYMRDPTYNTIAMIAHPDPDEWEDD